MSWFGQLEISSQIAWIEPHLVHVAYINPQIIHEMSKLDQAINDNLIPA